VHVDVHSERAEQLYLTSQEVLENLVVDEVNVTLSDDVEHNRLSPREQVESPKGSYERVSHSSPIENIEVHEVSVESSQVQTDTIVEKVEVHYGSHSSLASPVVVERSLAASASMTIPEEKEVVVLQQQHVHPIKNI